MTSSPALLTAAVRKRCSPKVDAVVMEATAAAVATVGTGSLKNTMIPLFT